MPHSTQDIDLPDDVHPDLKQVIDDHKLLFTRRLGKTMTAEHLIDTGNATPVKVPPRSIPFHYTERVTKQLEDMAKEGIIRPSNSPWCAPAVYVPNLKTLQIHSSRKQLHGILIVMLLSSSLVLASFCPVHALQMFATRADLELHVTFIVMLPSSLLVLASFHPVHALQMLANYL